MEPFQDTKSSPVSRRASLSYRPKLVTAGIGKAAYRGVLDASTSPPKERYAVSNDNVIQLIQPGIFDDQ
ncbi:hypothetical protein, partial [Bradyrhizobium sp. 142]|uniref:hypothetical protein n=1 Tax=Bradyrhizobium sp. 142 TaxID=2782618 RepID=UPI001FF86388